MAPKLRQKNEFVSGQIAPPGVYIDVETGSVVTLKMEDALPEGVRIQAFERHFRRVEAEQAVALPEAA